MLSLKSAAATLRPTLSRIALKNNVINLASRDMTILSTKSGEEYRKENYNERMAKTGRPVSPHVTIYQFPIAALTSIAVRVTGVSLSIGSLGVASLEIASSGSALQLMNDIAMTGPVVAGMAKVVVGFPLVYHYLGGVRHLVWDHYPAVLSNIGVEKASYALAGGSVVLTAGLALI